MEVGLDRLGKFLWRTFVRDADMVDRIAEGLGALAAAAAAWSGTTRGWGLTIIILATTATFVLGRRAYLLDEQLQPKLKLHVPRVEKDEKGSPCVAISIENIGGKHLKECLVTLEKVTPSPPDWSFKDVSVGIPTVSQSAGGRAGSFNLRPRGNGEVGQTKPCTVIRYDMDGWIEVNTEYGWKRISLTGGRSYEFEIVGHCEFGSRVVRTFRVHESEQQGFSIEVLS